jgi:hypothetical protein
MLVSPPKVILPGTGRAGAPLNMMRVQSPLEKTAASRPVFPGQEVRVDDLWRPLRSGLPV